MLWYRDGYGCNVFGNGMFGNIAMAVVMGIGLILVISIISKMTKIKISEKESIKILKNRYSKGEVTKEEYDEMKKNIK